MKVLKIIGVVFSLVMLNGCSWLYGENGLVHDSSNDFVHSKELEPLEVPNEYSKDKIVSALPVPDLDKDAANQAVGPALDVKPTLQVLAVVEGMRANRQSKEPSVFWLGTTEQLKQNIELFFSFKEIKVNTKSSDGYETDWVVNDHDSWWSTIFGSDDPKFTRDKYRLKLNASERPGEQILTVSHVAHQFMSFGEEAWQTEQIQRRNATAFLNQFVGYMDYVERKSNAKKLSQLNRGIVVSLGQDVDKHAALVTATDWKSVWLKTPEILEKFGFKLNDKDVSTKTYFFEFKANEPGFFASMFGADEAVSLPLKNGPYQVIIKPLSSENVSISFIGVEGTAIPDAKMAEIFPYLSEAYGRKSKHKKLIEN